MVTESAHPVLAPFAALRNAFRRRRAAKAALRDDLAAVFAALDTTGPTGSQGVHWNRLRTIALRGGPEVWRRSVIAGLASDAWRSAKVFWPVGRGIAVAITDMDDADKDELIRRQRLRIEMLSLAIRLGYPRSFASDPAPADLRRALAEDRPSDDDDFGPILYDDMEPALRDLSRALNGTGRLRTSGYEGPGIQLPRLLCFEAAEPVAKAVAQALSTAQRHNELHYPWGLEGHWYQRQSGWRVAWVLHIPCCWDFWSGSRAKRRAAGDLAWMTENLPGIIHAVPRPVGSAPSRP